MTAQDLKNAILQLAIQGKLVEQRHEEGTAENELRKHGKKPTTGDDSIDLPESWCWALLPDISSILYGFPFNSERFNEAHIGMPVIRIRDIINGQSKTYSDEECDERYRIKCGDMLVGMDGNFQVAFWNSEDAWLNQRVCKISADTALIEQKYLYFYLPIILAKINGSVSYSTVKHLSAKILNLMMIPLPPLAEQKRIVAKIEELLPLVEEYGKAEERLTAMNAEFPDKLRKSILQQAIQGKLTERDPADEPASELLKRIRAEKERLIKDGKIKKEKPLPPITEDEIPFEIPEGWEWVRLGNIADLCLGKMLDKTKNKGKLHPYLRNVNVRWGSFDFSDILQMRFEDDEEERYSVHFGDLVVCEGGEPGRCAVWTDRQSSFRIQKALHRVRFYKGTNSFFAYRVFEFYAANGYFAERFTGATIKHLPGVVLANILFPLPPLAEQQRIVDRVNELLAVCDELK